MMNRILVALLAVCAPLSAAGDLARAVTIYRDSYGVPHIFGKTDASVVFGLMYAQAEDNFRQLEHDTIRAVGRAAELDARFVAGDILVRAYETVEHAKEHYQHASPQLRALCDAYAAGVNYYLETHPQVKPRLLDRFEPWFILAEEHRGPAGTGITAAERARMFPVLAGAADVGAVRFPGELPAEFEDTGEGSNMWAIAPSKTTTGHAMLLINPHVGFFGGGQRYEAHLHSGEGLDVSGFAILSTPYIRSGFNRHLGWSHTNNYATTATVYVEKFDDASRPLAYRYGNGYRLATEWTAEVRVKTASGVETRKVVFRKTHHGPILGMRANGEGLAVRAAGASGGVMEQRWAMAKARNLREFQAALGRVTLTGSNTIYADQAGNIYYLHGNALPQRSTKFDWTKPVDGSDPETEWQGLHKLAELPQVLNPKSGWVQNCNSTPFLTTEGEGNPVAANYPAYMAPEPDTPRSRRSREILRGGARFSFEQWAAAGLDTKIGAASARVPELLAVYAKLKQEDPARAAKVAELIAEIERWDQVGRIDSVATTLFVRVEARAIAPQGGRVDPYLLITALETAKADLEAAFGTWRVPWGDVNRMQRVHTSGTEEPFSDDKPSVPIPGAPTFTGTILTFGARPAPGQKRWYGTVGDTYVAVVDFGKRPRARSLLVFGESADPASPHFFDQAPLYSAQQFKPAWFELGEIQKHVEKAYHPGADQPAAPATHAGKSYPVDGIVVATDRFARTMLVSHRPIGNYMPAMMMPFRAADPSELEPLAPGARVHFTLAVSKDHAEARDIRRAGGEDVEIAPPKERLRVGDTLPDFRLTDQDGRTVTLADLRGKVAAVDFIYTRCPLPDVCPRLSANFAALARRFAGSDLLLLSVTVDPEFDTPSVLAEYAKRWSADRGQWRFLTGEVGPLAAQLGEVYWMDEGSIGHNSMTSIIGRDGRLKAVLEGAGYRVDQLENVIGHELKEAK